MQLKGYMALRSGGDDDVSFHASTSGPEDEFADETDANMDGHELVAEPADTLGEVVADAAKGVEIADYDGHATPQGAAKMASSGVIVVGSGPTTGGAHGLWRIVKGE